MASLVSLEGNLARLSKVNVVPDYPHHVSIVSVGTVGCRQWHLNLSLSLTASVTVESRRHFDIKHMKMDISTSSHRTKIKPKYLVYERCHIALVNAFA